MQENLNDLRAFVIVAQSGSFTKAGALLGVSTSALSHTIKGLEERLKIKLFHRTTRSISTTEAGEQLFQQLAPLLTDIELKINELSLFRDTLKGKLRLNGSDHAFIFALWDKLQAFMERYPEVELELTSEQKFSDIVAERFDAGIRLGPAAGKRAADDDGAGAAASGDRDILICIGRWSLSAVLHSAPEDQKPATQHGAGSAGRARPAHGQRRGGTGLRRRLA